MDDIEEEINLTENSNNTDHNTTEEVLQKAEIMTLNNGWNDKNERIIISVGENAASYKWMHERCSAHHKFTYNFMSILLIILSTALTAETIFPSDSTDIVFDIIRRLVVYIVNLISVLLTFFKSEETSEKHLAAANAFSNLYHDIQQQMCMFRRDRINATKYVSECLKQYDSLVINGPDISSRVLRSFKTMFKNSDIALPDIADKIQKIEIISEDGIQMNNFRDKKIKSKGKPVVMLNQQNKSIQNCNNLAQIHNAFQIHGDISDRDLQNFNAIELKELRNKFLKQKSDYEYQRFLQHSQEND
jgi:hypothetical protein